MKTENSSLHNSLAENAEQFIRFVSNRVKSLDLAEDLFQDAFVKALQFSDGPIDEEKAKAWFYRILRNVIIDFYRSQASTAKKLSSYSRDVDVLLASNEVKHLCCDYEAFFLDRIKPDHASILRELDLNETPLAEYARQIGKSEGAVRVRRHRARQELKSEILKVCRCLSDNTSDCGCS